MSSKLRRPIRIFLAAPVLFAICMIAVPAMATPNAADFFVPTDFSASLEVVLQTVPPTDPAVPVESRETTGTNVSDSLSREVTTGPPGVGSEVRVSIGGTAGLDLGAFGGAEVIARARPDTGEQVLGYGRVQAGVTNRFIAVPRSGFSGTEAFVQFDVSTQGLLFAELYDSIHASGGGGSSVLAGVELNVPGWCYGCLGDYYFEDGVSTSAPQHLGVSDHYRFEGYIPVNTPVVMNAGLSISTGMNSVASFPDGFFSGKTGGYFNNTLRFGVSSTDPVDFIWASDLFFDRQPSVSDQPQVPAPATGVLLLSGLIGLAGYGRKTLFRK